MVKKGKSTMKIRGYEVNLKEKHAIAFDFDGVIVNTEPQNAHYLQETLKSFGVYMDHEELKGFIGVNSREKILHYLSRSKSVEMLYSHTQVPMFSVMIFDNNSQGFQIHDAFHLSIPVLLYE